MFSEILKFICVRKHLRGLRDQDLTPVPRRGDARGAVHIDTDIALGSEHRLACVNSHSNSNHAALKSALTVTRSIESIACARERDEEGVSLRVHLDARVIREGSPQHTSVRRESMDILVAELVEQTSRPLDVGEEEGDSPGGKLWHGSMMKALSHAV